MPHRCTLWVKGALDVDASATFAAPVEFMCRWEDRNQKFQEHSGDELISTSIIYIQNTDLIKVGDMASKGSRNQLVAKVLSPAQLLTLAGTLGMTSFELSVALSLVDEIPGVDYNTILNREIIQARIVRAKNETTSINGKDNLIKLYCQ